MLFEAHYIGIGHKSFENIEKLHMGIHLAMWKVILQF